MAKSLSIPSFNLKDINIRRIIFVRRFLILSVIMGVAAVSMVLFAIVPQVQHVIETESTISRENTVLRNLQRKIQGLNQVSDLEEYSHKDRVDQALPVQKPLLPVLETARRVSFESGARIVSIETSPGKLASVSAQPTPTNQTAGSSTVETLASPQSVDTKSQVRGVDKMDIAVTVQGTLPQISDFVSRIERSTPIMSVTEIQLNDENRFADQSPQFTAQLRLSAYYFTQAIQVAIDAPLPETGVKEREFLRELDSYTVSDPGVQSTEVSGGGQEDLFGIVR